MAQFMSQRPPVFHRLCTCTIGTHLVHRRSREAPSGVMQMTFGMLGVTDMGQG